ncbi:hypothetical protein HDV03_000852 [Kappamyces sp. JEL0829]|nr:hypothetical protein HDV03_000852 [Kappamyces sp. JEL0829]
MCGRTHFRIGASESFNQTPTEIQPVFLPQTAAEAVPEAGPEPAVGSALSPNTTDCDPERINGKYASRVRVVNGKWGMKMPHHVINIRDDSPSSFMCTLKNKFRCIVPCVGWYEWKDGQPYCFQAMAYAQALASETSSVDTYEFLNLGGVAKWNHERSGFEYLIMTQEAHPSIGHIHHRMPVLVRDSDVAVWLDASRSFDQVRHLLDPSLVAELVTTFPVSKHVNDTRNKDADCIKEIRLKRQTKLDWGGATPKKAKLDADRVVASPYFDSPQSPSVTSRSLPAHKQGTPKKESILSFVQKVSPVIKTEDKLAVQKKSLLDTPTKPKPVGKDAKKRKSLKPPSTPTKQKQSSITSFFTSPSLEKI